jgi:hypothetical protein
VPARRKSRRRNSSSIASPLLPRRPKWGGGRFKNFGVVFWPKGPSRSGVGQVRRAAVRSGNHATLAARLQNIRCDRLNGSSPTPSRSGINVTSEAELSSSGGLLALVARVDPRSHKGPFALAHGPRQAPTPPGAAHYLSVSPIPGRGDFGRASSRATSVGWAASAGNCPRLVVLV